jgi:hypothetical protein
MIYQHLGYFLSPGGDTATGKELFQGLESFRGGSDPG